MRRPRRFKAFLAAAGMALVLFLAVSTWRDASVPGNGAVKSVDGGSRLVIGAADANDAFYSAAGALSVFFENHRSEIDLDIRIQVSPGSVYNAESVIAGDMDIALVQSAVQSAAVNGRGPWRGRPQQKSLRSICSLFTGALMLIAPDDSSIETLQDLAGKRVGVNIPGSGTNMNTRDLLDFPGHAEWAQRIARREEVPTPTAISMLGEGKLDAVFINSGHPAEAVVRLIRESGRPLRFVPIDNIPAFMRQFPAYVDHYIPLASYPGIRNNADVKTIGTPTTLVTTEAMPGTEGYRIAKTIYEGFDDLRALHPSFADINRTNILAGLEAPLHSGCERFFRDAGLRSPTAPAVKDETVILASAPPTTDYYQLSANLANHVNQNRQSHGVRIFVSSTSGSVESVNMLISGQASFGIAIGQSLLDATRAQGAWSDTVRQRKLRALARVGSDSYFLIVAEDAIENGRLIPGARISVGLPGSGEEAMAELLLSEIPGSETAELMHIDVIEGRRRMAAREIDATLFPVFHQAATPPESIGPQLSESIRFSDRPLRLVSLGSPAKSAAGSTFYQTTVTLPPAEPGGGERVIFSLTTPVIFFTSVDVPEKVIRTVCESLLESADSKAKASNDDVDAVYPEPYPPADWRHAFSGIPITMHDSMVKLVRERKRVDMDAGPSPYEDYLVFGSGPPDSDFAQAAGALAAVVNHEKEFGQPLLVVKPPRKDDADNIDRLLRGEFSLCLSERINAIDAFNGQGFWRGQAKQDIRRLGTAYVSSLTVLVNDNEASRAFLTIADLNGQRVSLPAGRNQKRDNAVSIFSDSRVFEGISNHTLLSANEPDGFGPGIDLLDREAVKALVFTSGSHPNKDVMRILGGKPLRPLPGTGIHSLLMNDKGYTMTSIPAAAYGAAVPDRSNVPDVPTLGIPVDLLATADLPEAEAYRIVWKMVNRLEEAGQIFPGFENMRPDMVPGDSPVPLHEGARRAYLDAGLIVDEEDRTVQNVVVLAVDPYCDGLLQAERLADAIAHTPLARLFRGYADVSNSIDLSLELLNGGFVEFGVFPSVLLFTPETGSKLRDLRSVAWFGTERFVCITRSDSGINSFADLSGKKIGLPDGSSIEEASFDALCRILKPNNPPRKVKIAQYSFMTALIDGRVDAAILTVGRLETYLDAVNMTPASKRIRYVDFRQGFADDIGARLAAMMTGLSSYSFEIPGGTPFATPVYFIPNVMLTADGMPEQHVRRMAWMLDPDNTASGLSIAAPGRPAAPGMRPARWRNLPLPLHAGVENYLRGKEDGKISAQNPERLFR